MAGLALSSVDHAAAARSGGGAGGLIWLYVVAGIIVIGAVGYVAYACWKRKIAQDQVIAAHKKAQEDAVRDYEKGKMDAFMSKYEKDLELKSRKGRLKLTVEEQSAIDDCRAGRRGELMKAIDDKSNKCTVDTCDGFGRSLLMIAAGDAM